MSVYIPKDPTKHARAKRSKYRNVKVTAGGKKFDSAGERNRYFYLYEALRQGKISSLERQIKYVLHVNGIEICSYIADFVYGLPNGQWIVEDFKGGYRLPPDWHIKKKLMLAVHGIDVKIVKSPTEKIG